MAVANMVSPTGIPRSATVYYVVLLIVLPRTIIKMIRCAAAAIAAVAATDNQGQPISISNGSFEGDRWRPELEAIDATVKDTQAGN